MTHPQKENESVMKCEDIQSQLFDYLSHELGGGRADLVREHVRKCPDCQKAASEIQETLELLSHSGTIAPPPGRLSDERRKRIAWAVMHPILDWMFVYHILVSLVAATLVIIAAAMLLMKAKMWSAEPLETGPEIIIGVGPPPGESGAPGEGRTREP